MIYKHFKGNYYLRLPDSFNSEKELVKTVNYIPLYLGNFRIYSRSFDNFTWRHKELGEKRFTKVSLWQYLTNWIK